MHRRLTHNLIKAPYLGLLLLLLLVDSVYATRQEHVVSNWRPLHFDVTITLDEQLQEIKQGQATITVEALIDHLSLIDFDFGALQIEKVSADNRLVDFERQPGRLNVHLANPLSKGRQVSIQISYHGKPADGLILQKDKDGRPSATGDNWPDRVHNWIPCLDHPSAKATVAFTVTAPDRDLVVANGSLQNSKPDAPGMTTWRYIESVPIPAYCMVIAVGEYAKSGPTTPALTPLSYYVPRSDGPRAVQGFVAAAPSLKLFSETIAPYPYEKLALIVGATQFGGMENSSAIVFAGNLLSRTSGPPSLSKALNVDRGLERVVAHEIAHQWFGDSVTESTWADLWLSEGFATYFAGLLIEKVDGEAEFREYMNAAARSYFGFARSKRIPIHDTETEKLFDLLNENNYQKAAWILHMLRTRLGDDAFFKGLRIYYEAHKGANASTDDLRAALEKASGQDLKQFFARWIYGAGHPLYAISYELATGSNGQQGLVIHLSQKQSDAVFTDPVTLEIVWSDRKLRELLKPLGKDATIHVPATSLPNEIKIDPDGNLLKEVQK